MTPAGGVCVACGLAATMTLRVEAGPADDILMPWDVRGDDGSVPVLPAASIEVPTCTWHGRGRHVWPVRRWIAVYDVLLERRLGLAGIGVLSPFGDIPAVSTTVDIPTLPPWAGRYRATVVVATP